LSGSDGRLAQMDGLRGLAALVVVIFHFMSAFLPQLIPDQTDKPGIWADTPLGILFNGPFAVSVFFVLSGFVVSNAAAKRTTPVYVSMALRYVRLAVPVLFSVIFAWALLGLMPSATEALGGIIPHPWLQWTYQNEIPSLPAAILHGGLMVFVRGASYFDNVLWTMQIELVGSLIIYLVYGTMDGRLRTFTILALGVLCCSTLVNPAYLGFVLGALMRDAWAEGRDGIAPSLVLIIGILLGFPGHGFSDRIGAGSISVIIMPGEQFSLVPPLAAAMIVYGVLYSRAGSLLEGRPVQFLGRISFSLYLVHVPLLYTIFAMAYVRLRPDHSTLALIFVGFIVLSLVTASLFEILFDAPTLRFIAGAKTKMNSRAGQAA